jgi:hypothetical protein
VAGQIDLTFNGLLHCSKSATFDAGAQAHRQRSHGRLERITGSRMVGAYPASKSHEWPLHGFQLIWWGEGNPVKAGIPPQMIRIRISYRQSESISSHILDYSNWRATA